MSRILVDLLAADRSEIGRKADGLRWLVEHGHRVPATWTVGFNAASRLPGDAARDALAAIAIRTLRAEVPHAVRSSADVEDGLTHSFAGQFVTRLDVPDPPAIAAAAEEVVGSARHDSVLEYARRAGLPGEIRMAVIIQEMVPAVVSGVAFSKNPVTGLDEVIIEAVRGTGAALVQEGATPERWVHRWGAITARPDDAILADDLVAAIAAEVRAVAAEWGLPVDLEWAWDGSAVWWLQVRSITGLENVRIYSNRISREVLPGLIPPLVWSINVPVVNRAWIRLIEQVIGPSGLQPEALARSFGYRAYFEMTAFGRVFQEIGLPKESLELLLGLPRGTDPPRFRPSRSVLRHMGRILATTRELAGYGPHVRGELRELGALYADLAGVDLSALDDAGLLARVDRLMVVSERGAYVNIVTPLLMSVYGRLLAARLAAHGIDPTSVDPAAARADGRRFDPRHDLDAIAREVAALEAEDAEALSADGWHAVALRPGLAGLAVTLDDFEARYGHLSESGADFSVRPWQEDRGAMLRMVLGHVARERESGPVWDDLVARLPFLERPIVRSVYVRAGAFRLYRDAASFSYTRGHALFRPTFLELGARLVGRGLLDAPDDVFLLTLDEVRLAVAGIGVPAEDPPLRDVVARRRHEMEEATELDLPDLIYGEDFVPRRRTTTAATVLSGIPTSRGNCTGRARVIRRVADFDRAQPGDIVIVPHSDVSWTPLFARAGAIVAEAGGILSHSSIVAREYGIPCVVSVSGACTLIPDGSLVVVDGYHGEIRIEPSPAEVAEVAGDTGAGAPESDAGDPAVDRVAEETFTAAP